MPANRFTAWCHKAKERFHAWHAARRAESIRLMKAEMGISDEEDPTRWTPEGEYGRIEGDERGFALILGRRQRWRVDWSEIVAIRTFKRDLFTFDMVCLEFKTASGEYCEAWEDMVGFTEFTERMQAEFPTVPQNWYGEVMLPAFATNQRVLWRRSRARS
jgi:hypothetical protein